MAAIGAAAIGAAGGIIQALIPKNNNNTNTNINTNHSYNNSHSTIVNHNITTVQTEQLYKVVYTDHVGDGKWVLKTSVHSNLNDATNMFNTLMDNITDHAIVLIKNNEIKSYYSHNLREFKEMLKKNGHIVNSKKC